MDQPEVKCELNEKDQEQNEERALSVFASEKNEDLTALGFVLVVTFLVLLFTKWMA
ncbi:hypothetical protein [Pseudodesulfovibrio piezophilus]|uniref:Uncharacterized protein n=1 Tax=Pseudodesulfovibrio piezophilus (strain DSM 21447 / JCM 15486 / C1TLV30) TaxID=1322246 RepID=M1WKA8_PSEP2|nr:hypothetical protein [Pseudodesulfovibrio piezophilus]CCH49276.1 protein of unknown function [Pseudodesulfovibrio piezophilus C1TLV30]